MCTGVLQVLAALLDFIHQLHDLGVEHALRLDDGVNFLVDAWVQNRLALHLLHGGAELDGHIAEAGWRSAGLPEDRMPGRRAG